MLSRDAVDPERQRLVRPAPADCPTSLLLPSPSFSFLLLPSPSWSRLFPPLPRCSSLLLLVALALPFSPCGCRRLGHRDRASRLLARPARLLVAGPRRRVEVIRRPIRRPTRARSRCSRCSRCSSSSRLQPDRLAVAGPHRAAPVDAAAGADAQRTVRSARARALPARRQANSRAAARRRPANRASRPSSGRALGKAFA